jgi:hypothetical protein
VVGADAALFYTGGDLDKTLTRLKGLMWEFVAPGISSSVDADLAAHEILNWKHPGIQPMVPGANPEPAILFTIVDEIERNTTFESPIVQG